MHEFRHFSVRQASSAKAEHEDFRKVEAMQLVLDCVLACVEVIGEIFLGVIPDTKLIGIICRFGSWFQCQILVSVGLLLIFQVGRLLSMAEEPEVAQDCFQRGVVPPQANQQAQGGRAPQLLGRLPASTEYISALCNLEVLMNSDEYLELFDKPSHYVLESERVWPVEPFLKY